MKHAASMTALVVGLLTLAGCAGGPSSTEPVLRPAKYETFSRSENNRVVIHGTNDLAKYEVYSHRGIGSAVITLTDGDWPRAAVVRLHTKFLESFTIETSEPSPMRTGVSVSSYGGHEVRQEPPREPGDPLYVSLKIADMRKPPLKPRLPIEDEEGYFEIAIPEAMLRSDARWIKFSWIDVYRR